MFGFKCVAINIEVWLNISTLHLVYNHIWPNLPEDDCLFFLCLLMDGCHLGAK
jgi:hypothetical protein